MFTRSALPTLQATLKTTCRRRFTVLALESSADDTCAAVVTSDRKILANVVLKHPPYGTKPSELGIHPYHAIQHHQKNMPVAIQKALQDSGMTVNQMDGIAFTRGPGMPGCLAVAANAGRGIAAALNKPIVGVHHMQAHALTPMLTTPEPPQFPFLTLLVSGGHTLLLVAEAPDKFRTLATTVDSAVGQAIDSCARLLNLPWHDENGALIGPGAALERLALREPPEGTTLPPIPKFPIAFEHHLKFSFSGPKGEVNRLLGKLPKDRPLDDGLRIAIARGFQTAVFGQIEEKVELALRWCEKKGVNVSSLIVSGGVGSNQFLRSRLDSVLERCTSPRIPLICPPINLCTDNAVMIGWASMYRFLKGDYDTFDVSLKPTWPLDELVQGTHTGSPVTPPAS